MVACYQTNDKEDYEFPVIFNRSTTHGITILEDNGSSLRTVCLSEMVYFGCHCSLLFYILIILFTSNVIDEINRM